MQNEYDCSCPTNEDIQREVRLFAHGHRDSMGWSQDVRLCLPFVALLHQCSGHGSV